MAWERIFYGVPSKFLNKNEEPFKSLLERTYENELKIISKDVNYVSYEIEFEGTIISDKNRKEIKLNIFDETDYSIANIPPTKDQFSYDEELMLEANIDIQVEHSENLNNHKSNFVEFISRNLSSKTDEANLRIAFEATNYLNKGEEKFKVNLMKNADLTSSIIVKYFFKFDKHRIFH